MFLLIMLNDILILGLYDLGLEMNKVRVGGPLMMLCQGPSHCTEGKNVIFQKYMRPTFLYELLPRTL